MAKIRLYAGLGSTMPQIAAMVGKSEDTLRRNPEIVAALEAGRAETLTKVAGKLVQQALSGNITAAIFYLKTQGGWKETDRHEHGGFDGAPIAVAVKSDMDLSKLSVEELRSLESIMQKAASDGAAPA